MRTRDNQTAALPANETGAAARIRRQFNDAAEAAIKELPAADTGVNVHVHLGGNGATQTADKDGKGTPTTLDAVMTTLDSVVKSVAALSKTVTKLTTKGKARDADESDADEDRNVQTDDADPEDDEGEEEAEAAAKKETKDSAAYANSYQSVLAGAEVLVPGMKVPTFDAKRSRTATMDSMCKVRTTALDRFGATPAGAKVLDSLTAGKGYDSLTSDCKATAALFKSAVAVQTANVNSGMTQGSGQAQRATHDGQMQQVVHPGAPSISSIAQRHKDFWSKQGVRT